MDLSENERTFATVLGNLWSKPKPNFTPVFHCELQLIGYLDRHNVTVHMNLIGVSKLMPMSQKSTIAVRTLMCCPGPLARHTMHG